MYTRTILNISKPLELSSDNVRFILIDNYVSDYWMGEPLCTVYSFLFLSLTLPGDNMVIYVTFIAKILDMVIPCTTYYLQ